jgi:hypothetical protein
MLDTTVCDKVCQEPTTGRWFSLSSLILLEASVVFILLELHWIVLYVASKISTILIPKLRVSFLLGKSTINIEYRHHSVTTAYRSIYKEIFIFFLTFVVCIDVYSNIIVLVNCTIDTKLEKTDVYLLFTQIHQNQ